MMNDPKSRTTAAAFCAYLDELGRDSGAALARIDTLYDEDVVFTDPIRTLRGRAAFKAMNARFMQQMREIRFDVSDVAEDGDNTFVVSRMTVRPRFAGIGPRMTFDAVTHLKTRGGLVVVHHDYFDIVSGATSGASALRTAYQSLLRKVT